MAKPSLHWHEYELLKQFFFNEGDRNEAQVSSLVVGKKTLTFSLAPLSLTWGVQGRRCLRLCLFSHAGQSFGLLNCTCPGHSMGKVTEWNGNEWQNDKWHKWHTWQQRTTSCNAMTLPLHFVYAWLPTLNLAHCGSRGSKLSAKGAPWKHSETNEVPQMSNVTTTRADRGHMVWDRVTCWEIEIQTENV